MKHIFIILISTIVLQGCFTAIAGFNDGSSSNNIFNKIANANKPEKTEEEKLQQAQNKELRSCLAGEYRFKCADEIILKECDVTLFKQATLYLKCDVDGEYEIDTLYVKGTTKNDEPFEKVLNKFRSKRPQK